MKQSFRSPKRLRVWYAAAVLLLAWFLALTSLTGESPTFDEQGFLVRGLAYLRGDEAGSRRIRVGHPLGLNALNATFLRDDSSVQLPLDDPSWQGSNFHRPAELFMWEIGNDVEHIMFVARVPTVWLGLLLAALSGRWAGELTRRWQRVRRRDVRSAEWLEAGAASLALTLLALDPNVLAHARLATTDLGLATAACLAGYTLWRFQATPTLRRAAIAGASFGLLQNTKFTALLFVPLFGLVLFLALIHRWRSASADRPRLHFVVLVGLVYPLSAFLALWLTNGLQMGPLPTEIPLMPWLGGLTVPLSTFLEQLLDIGGRLQVSTPAFLLGMYSDVGWWYYFPVAFLLKTPLPALFLLGMAYIRIAIMLVRRDPFLRGQSLLDLACLLIPGLGFFAIALTTEINLGYRHLLPVLPFLFVFASAVLIDWVGVQVERRAREWLARGIVTAAMLTVIVSLWIYPHFLAFFNVLAGGPENGWRALVDSNIDWGQDLARLGRWQRETGVEVVRLSYFGEGRPAYYGINYIGLESFPPRLMNPLARPFVPSAPAPGWYAISATSLQGVHFEDHDLYRFFREREPAAKLGYSIFLYEVPTRGEPADVILSGIQPDEIAADDFTRLGTNDVTFRWIDGQQAILIPEGDRPTWLVESRDAPIAPALQAWLGPGRAEAGGNTYTLYRIAAEEGEVASPAKERFEFGEGRVSFLGAEVNADGPPSAEGIRVRSTWRQEGEPAPTKMYVHLLDSEGAIVSQWDGLGVAWEGWRKGDTLHHLHDLPLSQPLSPGTYQLVSGLYHPDTLERWRVLSGAPGALLAEYSMP